MRRIGTLAAVVLLFVVPSSYAGSSAFLGITLGKVDQGLAGEIGNEGRGVYVVGVVEGSGAEKAGIQPHDVIVEIDGERIVGPGHLGELLAFYSPGDRVRIKVWRSGGTRTLTAYLAARRVTTSPKIAVVRGQPQAWLGVTVQRLTGQLAEYFRTDEGVLISSVAVGSPAEAAGLAAGDVITEVDDERIVESVDLPNIISAREAGSRVVVAYVRGGKRFVREIELGETPEKDREKAHMYLWHGDAEDAPYLEVIQEVPDILKFPYGPLPPGVELDEEALRAERLSVEQEIEAVKLEKEALRQEREALHAEREALQVQMEELRRQVEELRKTLEELR